MNFNKFFRLMLVVILATTLFDVASGQVNLYQVGPYQYAQYNGIWYTVVDGKQGDLVDTQHLIVRLKDKSDIDRFDFVALALPRLVNVRGEFANGFYELEIPEGSNGFEMARRLEGTGKFDDVLFNIFLEVDVVPNDQYYGNQWNLPKVLMSNAWDISTGDNTIIVAVIDVGADYNHEDLIGNLWSGIGYDFYDNDPDPYPDDEARHGTAVAGILGAVTNNTIGVSGVAGGWGGAGGIRIMHLDAGFRWFDPALQRWRESISLSAATQATDYAAMNGARVINMSFSGGSFSPLQNAINNAVNTYGVIVIASAGNYNEGEPTTVRYPAAYSNVIAVGATIPSDNRKELNDGTENWWGSSYGSELDVMAPGVYIWTTDLTGSIGYSSGNYYDSFNGTSSAAPQVVGLAALILSINPSLTLQEVREIIRNSADKVPDMDGQNFHIEYGYGRINAYAALLSVLARNNQTVNQTATAYNNGRRIVRDGASYWHLVFSSGGQIFYRKRTPWGQWQPPIQLSNVNFNDFPCITMANNGAPYVSWQRVTGTNTYDIYFAMSLDNGDTWDIGDRYVVTSVSSTSNPLPVINSDNAGLRKFIVYRTSTGLKAHTTVTQFPYYVNWTQQSISINSYDSYPTLTYEGENFKTALSYQNANDGNIYYRYYGTNWSNPVNLSAIVPGVASHLTPSITNIPNNPQIHVAWKKLIGSGSSYYDHLIVHRRATNYYTWPNEWFGTYYERQEYPSITGLATNKVDMLFQTPPQFGNPYVYRMRFTGNYWGSPIYIGNNARYPSVSSGSTTANYVWTSDSTLYSYYGFRSKQRNRS